MFYVGHNLRTTLSFPHRSLKDLSNYTFLLKHLVLAIEGRCTQENGFLIQILSMKGYEKQKGIRVHSIEVTQEACEALIFFDCLCFKPQKGDIVDFIVDRVESEMIQGKLGAAEVIIPRQKMLDLVYNQTDNIYTAKEDYGTQWAISVGSILRCKVVQWLSHQDNRMKIIASVDQMLVDSKYGQKYE